MYQIVYISEAAVPFSTGDLRKLLAVARRKNVIQGVTGMLVYRNNQFLQVLEGDAPDVITTYDRIAKDPRHHNLLALHRGYSDVGKTFRETSMGFHSIALTSDLPPDYDRADGELDFAQFDGSGALDFLIACRALAALAQ
jgi:hypothetical protein